MEVRISKRVVFVNEPEEAARSPTPLVARVLHELEAARRVFRYSASTQVEHAKVRARASRPSVTCLLVERSSGRGVRTDTFAELACDAETAARFRRASLARACEEGSCAREIAMRALLVDQSNAKARAILCITALVRDGVRRARCARRRGAATHEESEPCNRRRDGERDFADRGTME
jgi:hypothetical protein